MDLSAALTRLSTRRPAFHSEDDLKFELAWTLKEINPAAAVRVEYPLRLIRMGDRGFLDLLVRDAEGSHAVEVKYRTIEAPEFKDPQEDRFLLGNYAETDYASYDYLADLERVEGLVHEHGFATGHAVLITNWDKFLRPRRRGTALERFRIDSEVPIIHGTMAWAPTASPENMRGREDPITIAGTYAPAWRLYSAVSGQNFRMLHLSTPYTLPAAPAPH